MNKFAAMLIMLVLAGCSQGDQRSAGNGKPVEDIAGVHPVPALAPFAALRAQNIKRFGSFASLADRGELLAYQDHNEPKQQGAYTWHRAEVSEAHALRAIVERKLRVVTPAGETLEIEYDHHIEHPSGDWTWVGHLPGDPGAQTILTFGAHAVFGSIAQAGKRSLRLTSRDGGAWLVETDPSKLVGIASAGANPRKRDHLSIPKQRNAVEAAVSAYRGQAQAVQAPITTAAAVTTIDVVVGYSGGIGSRTGGASAALTRINNLVAITNEAYANSQVNARIRLVRALQVSYSDATTNESALEQLTGYDVSSQQYTTPNAAFNGLRAAREQHGADLVVLLRQFRDPEQDGCGIAWLVGGGKYGIAPGDGQDYFGYSVVSDGTDRNEQDGNYYFCRDESFAHELGHNIGSQHDRETAKGGDGVLNDPDDYGAFSYSFGYKTSATAGNFFTIMAYGDEGQQDYRVFSNPRITLCGGRACGTANDDNARSLNQLVPLVASFRRGAVNPEDQIGPAVVAGNFDGDARSDIFWRHQVSGLNSIWLSSSSSTRLSMASVTDLRWKVSGVGDFDGDRRSDVLWRHEASGGNAIWLSANANARSSIAALPDVRWSVVGVGDFNGDGRSDILWRHQSSGANAIWLSANSNSRQAIASVADVRWKVAGIGDFNGDGRSDVLWRHEVSGGNAIWLSANYNSQQAIAGVSDLRWKVAGVAKFNADGRFDILWRHETSGANAIWLSGNSGTTQSISGVTDLQWKIASTGDFNGDGRSDILWRHAGNGSNVIWLSASSSSKQSVSSVTDVRWGVVG